MDEYVEVVEELKPPVYEMWNIGEGKYQWMVHYDKTEVFVPAIDYNEPFVIDGVSYTPVDGGFAV